MSETPPSNLERKLVFSRATSSDLAEKYTALISSQVTPDRILKPWEKDNSYQYRELNLHEKRVVSAWTLRAVNKLEELGIENAKELVPTEEQVFFFNFPAIHSDARLDVDGRIGNYGEYLRINVPRNIKLLNSEAEKTFFHELAHFVSKVTLRLDKKGYGIPYARLSHGLSHVSPIFHEGDVYTYRGGMPEALADIFALYCNTQNQWIAPSYEAPVFFGLALIEDYAKKNGITVVEAFKTFFQAETNGNFKLLRILVDLYGSRFVKEFNNIKTYFGMVSETGLSKAAELGGFDKAYADLWEEIIKGAVSVPGFSASFIKPPTPVKIGDK